MKLPNLLAAPVVAVSLIAIAGCGPASSQASPSPSDPLLQVNRTVSDTEPAWGQGWVGGHLDGPLPVLRPDVGANERLADHMATEAPYHWTGTQAACLDQLWMRVSLFDNLWSDDMFNGIAGLSGSVADPDEPFAPTIAQEQAAGWFAAQPNVQIAAGLADIEVFWGTPCHEWARDKSSPQGTYPSEVTNPQHPGWEAEAGSLKFVVIGGRLALDAESLELLCGQPGEAVPEPAPACSWVSQTTTWPMS